MEKADKIKLGLWPDLDFQRTLFAYSSDGSFAHETRFISYILLYLGLFLVLSECLLYVSIYWFLVRHDRSMRLVLSESTIRTRMRKNSIDLAGHMFHFAFGSFFPIMGMVGYYSLNLDIKWIMRCYNVSYYGILSGLQIGFSTPLRDEMSEVLQELSRLMRVLAQKFNRSGNSHNPDQA